MFTPYDFEDDHPNLKGDKLKEEIQFAAIYTNILRILPRCTLKLIFP
jgi:hypothetical protein